MTTPHDLCTCGHPRGRHGHPKGGGDGFCRLCNTCLAFTWEKFSPLDEATGAAP